MPQMSCVPSYYFWVKYFSSQKLFPLLCKYLTNKISRNIILHKAREYWQDWCTYILLMML